MMNEQVATMLHDTITVFSPIASQRGWTVGITALIITPIVSAALAGLNVFESRKTAGTTDASMDDFITDDEPSESIFR